MTFTISKNIPLTSDKQWQSNWSKPEFPFSEMNVGDSFTVRPEDCNGAPLIVVQNIASSAASTFVKGSNWKFATRQIGGKFVRVWRIA
tara:strand:- start:110 stop:373 length:264 start_codon:yes stop_codon:yes gene_type:complete